MNVRHLSLLSFKACRQVVPWGTILESETPVVMWVHKNENQMANFDAGLHEVCQGTCQQHLHLETEAAKEVHQARTPAERELQQPGQPAYLALTQVEASKDSIPTECFYCSPLESGKPFEIS